MKKSLKLFMVVVGMAMLFAATVIYAATEVPDVVRLANKAYKKHKYGIVEFSHKKHAEAIHENCKDCHKRYKKAKKLKSKDPGAPPTSCKKCHPKKKKKF